MTLDIPRTVERPNPTTALTVEAAETPKHVQRSPHCESLIYPDLWRLCVWFVLVGKAQFVGFFRLRSDDTLRLPIETAYNNLDVPLGGTLYTMDSESH